MRKEFLYLLFFVTVVFVLTSCSSIQEIKKDDTDTVLLENRQKAEESINRTPAVVEIPLPPGAFRIQGVEHTDCDTSRELDVDFQDADLSTILYSVATVAGYNVVVSEKQTQHTPVKKETTTAKQEDLMPDIRLSLRYRGKLSGFLEALSEKTGYFLVCRNGVIIPERTKVFNITVPNYSELLKLVRENIEKLGATDVSYDSLTSTISFTADYTTYQKARDLIIRLSENASLTTLRITLITVNYSAEKNLGIDWTRVLYGYGLQQMKSPFADQTSGQTGFEKGIALGFDSAGVKFYLDGTKFTLEGFLKLIETYGKYSILQDVFIQALSGAKGKIDVSTEIPYIKEISLSTSGTAGTVIGTATSDKAKSGVEMEITPWYSRDSGTLTLTLKVGVYEVIKLVTLEAGVQIGQITQPVVTKKYVETYLRLTPGQVALLGGLSYEKNMQSASGLPLDTYLTKTVGNTRNREELIILIRPSVINFVKG